MIRSPLCLKLLSSPIRQCFVTKRRLPSKMMLRFVRVRQENDSKVWVVPDTRRSTSTTKGRGVWLHPSCVDYAVRHEMLFERAFRNDRRSGSSSSSSSRKVVVPKDMMNQVLKKLRSDVYDALREAKEKQAIYVSNDDKNEDNDDVHLILTTSHIEHNFTLYDRPTIFKIRDSVLLHEALGMIEDENDPISLVKVVNRDVAEQIYEAVLKYDEYVMSNKYC